MERYKEYRPSKIQWLKEIPSHWKERRAKYLFKKENRTPKETDEVITCFRDGIVTLRKNRRTSGFTESLKEIGYQGIRKGDLVIHQMDAFAGSTGVSDSDGKGTPVYSVCTPITDGVQTEYFGKVIRLMGLNGFIQSLYRGIRERSSDFRFETFARQTLPLPSLPEQENIVRFLNDKIAKIDTYISEKEKEIQLLNELKESEIADIVTHGLNPNVKMKESGISWIGMIPEHWMVKRLKNVVSCNDEAISENLSPETKIEDVEIGDVNESKGIIHSTFYQFKDAPSRARRITRKNDIIISTVRTYLKAIARIDRDGLIVSTGFAVLRPSFINPLYLAYYTKCNGFTEEVLKYSIGISYPAISSLDLLRLKVIEPPLDEQRAIVAHIENKCSKINSLISELEAEIECLKEYKQRLIADCVTGQINMQNM